MTKEERKYLYNAWITLSFVALAGISAGKLTQGYSAVEDFYYETKAKVEQQWQSMRK